MKRKLSGVLMLAMLLSMLLSVNAFAASEKKENSIKWNGYTTVYLTGTKSANLKLYAYNANGNKINNLKTVTVTLKDTRGNLISEFDAESGQKIFLGNDHNVYRVYIRQRGLNMYELKSRTVTKWKLETDSNSTFDYKKSQQKRIDDQVAYNKLQDKYCQNINNNVPYCIIPKHAQNSVIDTYGGNSSKSEGSNIVLWNYGNGNYKSRVFRFVSVGGGWYKIVNENNGLVLDVNCSNRNVALYEYHGGINQHWKFESAGDGYYYIKTRVKDANGTEYYLDVHGVNSSNGTNVEVCTLNRGNNQKFKFKVMVDPK